MDDEAMRRRVAEARVARLATVTADGHPHLVPCCFVLDGDTIYTPIDGVKPKTTTALRRLANISARPDVALLVDHYDDDWSTLWWIRVHGRARALDVGSTDEGASRDLLAQKYSQYLAPGALGTMIAIEMTRWSSWP